MAAGIDKLDVRLVCRWITMPPLGLVAAAVIAEPTPGLPWLLVGAVGSIVLAWWPSRWPAQLRLGAILFGAAALGYGLMGDYYPHRQIYNLLLHLLVLMAGATLPWRQVGLAVLAAAGAYIGARYAILADAVLPYSWTTAVTDFLGYALLGSLVFALAEGQRKIRSLHQQLEDRSRHTETELQRTLEASHDMVMISTFDGQILSISPACREILGYEPEAMAGQHLAAFVHPEDRETAETRRRSMASYDQPFRFEVRYLHKDGHTVWLDWNAHADLQKGFFRSVARDITERKQADQLVVESEQRYRALFDCNPDIILVGSLEDGMVSANPAFRDLTGHDPAEIAGLPRNQRLDRLFDGLPQERDKWLTLYEAAARGQLHSDELTIAHRLGHRVPLEVTFIPMILDGAILGVYVVAKDISLRRDAEIAQSRLTAILEETTDLVALMAPDGQVLYGNRAVRNLLAEAGPEGWQMANLVAPESHELIEKVAVPAALRTNSWSGEAVWQSAPGARIPVSQVILAHKNHDGSVEYLSTIARDIGERKRFEAELAYQATHDALTGLLNRRGFSEALLGRLSCGDTGALLYLDLDEFKYINDSLGHHAGDEMLRNLGVLLTKRVRPGDILARLSGDEFVVMLPSTDRQTALSVAEGLLATLRRETVATAGQAISITASIGISYFPDHGRTMEELLAHADRAMYQAKEKGRNIASVYEQDAQYESLVESRMTWERLIRHALDGDGLVLFAQPILDLRSNRISHYELLLRMRDDQGVLLSPAAFLPVAERFGLIHQIDRWVVRQAIELLARHEAEGRDLFLEVNLSGKALTDPELLSLIRRELAASRIAPHRLVFEITETTAIADFDMAQEFVNVLKGLGCRFALDDFGAGFSSFDRLKRLPVDYLKLDGSFIRNLPHDEEDRHLVRAMVEVARSLNKQTIAEFVEDAATVAILQGSGVNYAQGYHIGRPRPVAEIWPTEACEKATAN